MFAFKKLATPGRSNHASCRFGGLLIVSVLSLALGACAHNGGDAPAMQWQFNSSEVGRTGPQMYQFGAAADETVERAVLAEPDDVAPQAQHAAPAAPCGHGAEPGWSDNCNVYRGGRDASTGRAYTQL